MCSSLRLQIPNCRVFCPILLPHLASVITPNLYVDCLQERLPVLSFSSITSPSAQLPTTLQRPSTPYLPPGLKREKLAASEIITFPTPQPAQCLTKHLKRILAKSPLSRLHPAQALLHLRSCSLQKRPRSKLQH